MKENEILNTEGFGHKLNLINHELQRMNKLGRLIVEKTGKVPTPDQLCDCFVPGKLDERQSRIRASINELTSGQPNVKGVDSNVMDEILNFAMSLRSGISVLNYYSDRITIKSDGTVYIPDQVMDEIKAVYVHQLTKKQIKARDWTERWIQLMSEPISLEIGFVGGVRGLPLTVADDKGTLKVNDNQIIKY
jgi:hypothetical protein